MKQLRFTTTEPFGMFDAMNLQHNIKPICIPEDATELIKDSTKGKKAYIHTIAEEYAGFDIPIFIDGNMSQLDLPIEQQDILMLLPSGEYKCKAEYYSKNNFDIGSLDVYDCYLITLFEEASILI